MKKLFLWATLAICSFAFIACDGGSNPDVKQTKLFPAMDANGDKWGYINDKGEMVLPAIYDKAAAFSCGYALVATGYTSYFIDEQGNKQDATFDSATPFYNNYSVVFLNNGFGLLNHRFDLTIEPTMEHLGDMGDNGLLCAKRQGSAKWEYVDANGETKIEAKFDGTDNFKGGMAIVYIGSQCGTIDKNGEYIIQPSSQLGLYNMGEGFLANYDSDVYKWALIDKNGKAITQPLYDDIRDVSDGLIAVSSGNNTCGHINTKGEVVIPQEYAQVTSFSENYAWATKSHQSAFMCIDKKNNVIFTLENGEKPITGFLCGLALVQTPNGYKYIGTEGQVIYEWTN
jgi:hypothetical protein